MALVPPPPPPMPGRPIIPPIPFGFSGEDANPPPEKPSALIPA